MPKLLYSSDPPFKGDDRAIFLAGPTPRSPDVKSWRPNAIEILTDLQFPGTILIPERHEKVCVGYDDQIEWEYAGLSQASVICIWVPRDLATMPAFTTNVEFGYWIAKSPDRVLYGRPNESPKNHYLDWLYVKEKRRQPHSSLESLLKECYFFATKANI
jgi:hypothetical protein